MAVATYFLNELKSRDMPCAGVIVNQMHPVLGQSLDTHSILFDTAQSMSADLEPNTAMQLIARLGVNHRRLLGLSQAEKGLCEAIEERLSTGQSMWHVPRLEGEVHDIDALGRVFEQARQVV